MEIRKRSASGHKSKIPVAEGEPSIYFRYIPQTGKYHIIMGLDDARHSEEFCIAGTITEWEAVFVRIRTESIAIKSAMSQRAKVRAPRETVRARP